MNVLKKAKSDSRIKALLSAVSAEVRVKYQKEADGGWSSSLVDGVATIGYSGCRHPSASLAHELLHIDTQLKGFHRPKIFISNIAPNETFRNLMNALDNELQHHKFYESFLGLGFKPRQFYQDSDAGVEEYLRNVLKSDFSYFAEILPQYLTAIAPGGSFSQETREKIRDEFRRINDDKYTQQFDAIDESLQSWACDSSYDIVTVLRRILLIIQPENNLTWIGFSAESRPPDQGVFIDKEFSVEAPSSQHVAGDV